MEVAFCYPNIMHSRWLRGVKEHSIRFGGCRGDGGCGGEAGYWRWEVGGGFRVIPLTVSRLISFISSAGIYT